MKRTRRAAGFTVVEMVVAVAILAVVAALAFVNIFNFIRSSYRLELDETAKELYLAAQNHLSIAESMGTLSDARSSRGAPGGGDYYYFVVNSNAAGDRAKLRDSASDLFWMLPENAIDETVISRGSFIIRYTYVGGVATVTDVFYATTQGSFGRFGHDFESGSSEYGVLFANDEYTTADGAAERRLNYNYGGRDAVIGYYGGDSASVMPDAGSAWIPKIRIENAEELRLVVSSKSTAGDPLPNEDGNRVRLEAYITGKASGKTSGPHALDTVGHRRSIGSGQYEYVYVLDSVTAVDGLSSLIGSGRDGHFATQFSGDGLIPGEDIQVQVFAVNTTAFAQVGKSAKLTTNSLFSSLRPNTSESRLTKTARIANIRHLENLSKDISGFDQNDWTGSRLDPAKDASSSSDIVPPRSALQLVNLSWRTFSERIANADSAISSYDKVQVKGYAAGGWTSANHETGNYMLPVNPVEPLDYEGGSHSITGVRISETPSGTGSDGNPLSLNAGLFGTLVNGSSIRDLDLVNFDIRTTNGSAGALVGAETGTATTGTTGTTISGVYAYNDLAALRQLVSSITSDSALEVRGSSFVGGLVGQFSGSAPSRVENSSASLYVRSTGGDGAAGGLVGYITSYGTVIENSYAGGHTLQGVYGDFATEARAGRYNVYGDNAGGLVGGALGTSISYCYATASAYGTDYVGGLVGFMQAGSVDNSYATGLVGTLSQSRYQLGAFAGRGEGTTFAEGCHYYELVNEYASDDGDAWSYLPAVPGQAGANVTALDATVESYNSFMIGSSAAKPYDATLPSTFPFRTIAELHAGGDSGLSAQHYGDWPTPETMVVNVRS